MFTTHQVTTTAATVEGNALVGEWTIVGPRGGTLLTVRTHGAKNVRFFNPNANYGVGAHDAAHKGNYSLPAHLVAAAAVTFTDSDRVA